MFSALLLSAALSAPGQCCGLNGPLPTTGPFAGLQLDSASSVMYSSYKIRKRKPAKIEFDIYPAGSVVQVDDYTVKSKGRFRTLETPDLVPGRAYVYYIQAITAVGGRICTDTKRITVRAGKTVHVRLRPRLQRRLQPIIGPANPVGQTECVAGCPCGRCEDDCRCGKGKPCGGANCSCLAASAPPAPKGPKKMGCICSPKCPCHDCLCAENETKCCKDCDCKSRIATHGVDGDKISPANKIILHSKGKAKTISKRQAKSLLEAGKLMDDSALSRVTVIGPAESRKQIEADWKSHPALADLKGKFLFQSYDPNHPLIARYGFVTTGTQVYIQRPDGLGPDGGSPWRFEYAGAEMLAGALRDADKGYDPTKDKDPTKKPALSAAGATDWAKKNAGLCVVALGAAGALCLWPRREEEKK